MSEIKNFQPAGIWQNFYLLTQVPRPSGHLDKVRAFLLDWAAQKGIDAHADEAGNVLMYKAATPGMENCKMVTLQGHMDMVPQKTADSNHDFENDPIETWVDGDWVRAKNTTLGADDGMAVATIMAIMEDNNLKHGPIEGFITADEETTMYGVNHMAPGSLKGEILLNLDNETDGEMVIGSAGGINLTATLRYREAAAPAGLQAVSVRLHNLLGGHSGLEINEGRANANKLIARLVLDAKVHCGARLATWHGGNMRNAIPRDVTVVLLVEPKKAEALKALAEKWGQVFTAEYAAVEKGLTLDVADVPAPATMCPEEIADNLVRAIVACHNGVMRFIPEVPQIVETSSNLAIVDIDGGDVMCKVLIRSSCDSMLEACVATMDSVFSMAGMKVETDGHYPAWQPNPKSPIVELMKQAYSDLFNVENKVQVVHAGLECGVIGAKCPGMDMVSFGPTLRSPHTPNERLYIPSVERYWRFVTTILERIPQK